MYNKCQSAFKSRYLNLSVEPAQCPTTNSKGPSRHLATRRKRCQVVWTKLRRFHKEPSILCMKQRPGYSIMRQVTSSFLWVPPLTLSQIQEIGMGWYQWQLFIVVGFGWANDNLWPIVTSLICNQAPNSISQYATDVKSSSHPYHQ